MQTAAPLEIAGLKSLSTLKALALTFGISVVVVGFLFWLLYFRTGSGTPPAQSLRHLPALNAALNGLSSVLLVLGFLAVRRRQYRRHMQFMLAALRPKVSSSALAVLSDRSPAISSGAATVAPVAAAAAGG